MFKKLPYLTIALALMASLSFTCGVLALNYSGSQGNKATFETLEEARVSGPLAVATLESNHGRNFKSHPALDSYPTGTTYVYRSANLYGGRAAARMNTDILVFAEKFFASKDAALQYITDLGLTKIVDAAIGSVVLVTPSDPKAGFTAADQKYYYALQTAILAQKASETVNKVTTFYSDAEYFGGSGNTYLVGIDGGATFLNNYVASTFDYVSRIAGMLLVNGKMDKVRNVATFVPVYLVNVPDAVIEKYKKVNDTDAYLSAGGVETFFNQALPLKRVVVAKDANADTAKYIKDAYISLFKKAQRIAVTKAGMFTASTPYQGGSGDQAPYSLCSRNTVINGVTEDGIHVIHKSEETFSDLKTADGEYLQTWYEFLPDEVLKGTAPAGTVPLILALHGSGDDPRQYVDEIGLLSLAGAERFAVVAPDHQVLGASIMMPAGMGPQGQPGQRTPGILTAVLPRLVKYILKAYPALDPSRVYVTGYSMGGGAVLQAVGGDPSVFAAAIPMAASPYTATPEQAARFKTDHLPIMLTTSSFDLPGAFDPPTETIAVGYQTQINLFLGYDAMNKIDAFDFKSYPIAGFKADHIVKIKLNGEYENTRWYINNADGVPMVALSYIENLNHALYPEYAKLAWEFAKHYSRDQKTGAINYNPYAK